MKIRILIKPNAEVDRIAGYISELPRIIDWEDVIESIKIDEEDD